MNTTLLLLESLAQANQEYPGVYEKRICTVEYKFNLFFPLKAKTERETGNTQGSNNISKISYTYI